MSAERIRIKEAKRDSRSKIFWRSSVLACETRELTIGMFPKGSMTTMIRKAIESMIVRDSRVGSRIQVFHKLLESIKY